MLRVVSPEGDDAVVSTPELEQLSAELSALLAEMVQAKEVEVAGSWAPEVKPGGTLGRFQLVRELGRGGFGVVYEAFDGELSRTVALKVVKPGTRIAARGSEWLMREAEAVARLNHPNIITLHDFGQGPSGPYLVFELLRGQSLAESLRAGPIGLDQAIDVGLAVSRALVHAHAAGVVHRDLTAGNVHLGEDGAVKVLDFGLAHLFGRDGVNDGGTPAYMAPEQWEGDRGDARTDLFALGVILFQALSGRYPYKIEKGWSEALEPGQTPRLPPRTAPRRLRRLVRSLLEREPERRPVSAKVVRDQLLALRRARDGAGRQRTVWGLGAVAATAVVLAAWLFVRPEPPPGEQVKVVMAAMENGAGEATLDAVPGLLAAALEPSPRVRLVPPSRLAYASRQAGLGDPGRIDAEKGRRLARLAGAAVVLVPKAWQEDGQPVVSVSAVESESGRALFTARAAVRRRGGLPSAVDRLSDRIRRELNERAADRELIRPVADSVTSSAEAARLYYEGTDCLAQAADQARCVGTFERALAIDPSFPLAHLQIAAATLLRGDSGELARPHLVAALRAVDRLPHREALLVRALESRIDGHADEALRLYDQLLAAAPEDAQVLAAASSLYTDRGDWTSAARYLEKLVAVEPDWEDPLLDLIEALGRVNRSADLRSLLERIEHRNPARARPAVEALLWLGEPARAVSVARSAVERRGDGELETLWRALYAAGDFAAMEPVARREWSTRQTADVSRHVEVSLTGQGRVAEALRWGDEASSRLPRAETGETPYRQAMCAALTGDRQRVWRYASRAFALDPVYAADLSIVLALLGDVDRSAQLAQRLEPGTEASDQYLALTTWRSGDATAAAALLAAAEERDPLPAVGLAPSYLLAEVSAASGDDVGTLAALARFDRLPARGSWRAWADLRARLLAAVAHERLGDREAARHDVDRILRDLTRADPGLPIVTEARAIRARLQKQE